MAEENQSSGKEEKGFLGGLGKITLVVAVLVIGYVIYDKMGIKTTSQSEKTTWHDKAYTPDRDYNSFVKTKQQQAKGERKFEKEAEKILAEFIEERGRKQQVSVEDRKFLDDVSRRLKLNDKAQNSSDFISFMQNSYKFYSAMKSIGKTEESRSSKWMNKLMNQNARSLKSFAEENPSGEEWMVFLNKD